jgi:sialic acid synthase SpsE
MKLYNSEFKISDKSISLSHPTYFIADIAANHDGDLSRAKDLIHLAAEAGTDAAKFQHFHADTIVSDYGFKSLNLQLSHQAKWNKSVYEVYKDSSLNLDWTPILKETCDAAGIHFFTSPYSFEIVDNVDDFVPAFKIGSGDITWTDIIKYIAKKQKPVLLATGASTLNDVCTAVEAVVSQNKNIALLQCNTNYTAGLENFSYINLHVLKTFQSMYPRMILGLSDHTPGHATVLGAVTLGARIIEKHFTDDPNRTGPDHGFSMTFQNWKEMVLRTRELEAALGTGVKKVEQNEEETVVLQRRAARAKFLIKQGDTLNHDNIEFLRPCPKDAVTPSQFSAFQNHTATRTIPQGDYLRWSDMKLES